jgi:elongation factor G
LAVHVAAPSIAYREVLIRPIDIEYSRDLRRPSATRFKLHLAPTEPEAGNRFVSSIAGGMIATEALASIEAGVRTYWETGPVVGFPIVDMIVTLTEADLAESDNGHAYLSVLVGKAMHEACSDAGCWVLEPIMDLEVVCRPDKVNRLIGVLDSRRGTRQSFEAAHGRTTIRAQVPLANMFGFISELRSIGAPDEVHTMRYSHHSAVPRYIAPGPDCFPPALGMRA